MDESKHNVDFIRYSDIFLVSTDTSPIVEGSKEINFQFEGSGRDYFPIWVSNFFLCLITAGLFTPWAKVRARKYFYSRTLLAGNSFSYSGDPWRILIGRTILVIGVLTLCINSILNIVSISKFLLILSFGGLFVPFLMWKSATFNFSNTSYRAISLSLDLTLKQFYLWALKATLLTIVTLGISTVTLSYQFRSFLISHLLYGDTRFIHKTSISRVLAKLFPLAILMAIIVFLINVMILKIEPGAFILGRIVNWIGVIFFLGFTDSVSATYICDHLQLGKICFRSGINKWELAGLYTKAGVLTFLSFGFFWPWVRIEILRYKLERIKVYAPPNEMESFTQLKSIKGTVSGGFATELFDLDFGI